MKKPKHARTKAQQAATKKYAAAGRAAQARKRAYNKAHHLPTRSKAQHQASLKWAAAGRQAQVRKRNHLKPLPKHQRAAAWIDGAGCGIVAGNGVGVGGTVGVGDWPVLYQPGAACAATALANHLFVTRGVAATTRQIAELHRAAGGDDERGVLISDVLELLASRGLAGVRVERFWPVAGWNQLPGLVAGLRLPQGAHTVLTLGGPVCASWGSIRQLAGQVEEAWWVEWA